MQDNVLHTHPQARFSSLQPSPVRHSINSHKEAMCSNVNAIVFDLPHLPNDLHTSSLPFESLSFIYSAIWTLFYNNVYADVLHCNVPAFECFSFITIGVSSSAEAHTSANKRSVHHCALCPSCGQTCELQTMWNSFGHKEFHCQSLFMYLIFPIDMWIHNFCKNASDQKWTWYDIVIVETRFYFRESPANRRLNFLRTGVNMYVYTHTKNKWNNHRPQKQKGSHSTNQHRQPAHWDCRQPPLPGDPPVLTTHLERQHTGKSQQEHPLQKLTEYNVKSNALHLF